MTAIDKRAFATLIAGPSSSQPRSPSRRKPRRRRLPQLPPPPLRQRPRPRPPRRHPPQRRPLRPRRRPRSRRRRRQRPTLRRRRLLLQRPPHPPAPAAAGSPVFPSAVDSKYASQKAGDARMHTCLDQYHANKAANGNGGLKWIQKGGGYYSECSKKLKG